MSTDLHLVADAGEQADFLHVLRPEEDAAGGFFVIAIPGADLQGRLGDLDDLVGGAVVLG